jgi:hypothetical protein
MIVLRADALSGAPARFRLVYCEREGRMSHFEELLAEYYEWLGHVVKCNAQVGKLPHGGWEMELDVVAYEPRANYLLHIEPSLDANSWEKREKRFEKKFQAGQKYILRDVFPWLPTTTVLKQRAVFVSTSPGRRTLAGAEVVTVDEMVAEIREAVRARGIGARAAIPEHYPLLRTIQLVVSGYYRVVPVKEAEKAVEAVSVHLPIPKIN